MHRDVRSFCAASIDATLRRRSCRSGGGGGGGVGAGAGAGAGAVPGEGAVAAAAETQMRGPLPAGGCCWQCPRV